MLRDYLGAGTLLLRAERGERVGAKLLVVMQWMAAQELDDLWR